MDDEQAWGESTLVETNTPEFGETKDDLRTLHCVARVQRVGQGAFRNRLMMACDRRCAISESDLGCTLQAAHISAYNGPKSQSTPNGILLRADLHLMFDALELAVDPKDYTVKLGRSASTSSYAHLEGTKLKLPSRDCDLPSQPRLRAHFCRFRLHNGL